MKQVKVLSPKFTVGQFVAFKSHMIHPDTKSFQITDWCLNGHPWGIFYQIDGVSGWFNQNVFKPVNS